MEAGQPAYPGQPAHPGSRAGRLAKVNSQSVYMETGCKPGWKRASPPYRDPGLATGIPVGRADFFLM